MGGIHATLLAYEFGNQIHGIFAIETSVTQFGSFIAKSVHEMLMRNEHSFEDWFQNFCQSVFTELAPDSLALKYYYASLHFVREKAFLENAKEMYETGMALKNELFTNESGHLFVKLEMPKIYCVSKSHNQMKNIEFLKKYAVPILTFNTESHWLAQTCSEEFCRELAFFAERKIDNRPLA